MGARTLRAFLAAPSDVDTEVVRQALTAEGVVVEDPYSVKPGEDVIAAVLKRIRQSDFVVALIGQGGWSAYEVGIADAFAKPVLIIASPDVPVPPHVAARQVLRTSLAASDVLLLTLRSFVKQVRSDPRPLKPQSVRPSKARAERATFKRLLSEIHEARSSGQTRQVESLVLDLLKASGATVVAQPPNLEDRGVDFAVWADALAQVSGGPLLVEVKAGRLTPDAIRNAEQLLARAMMNTSARIALLLYLDAEGRRFATPTWETPFVMRFDLEDFATHLATQSFPDLVIQQRNRLVHKMG